MVALNEKSTAYVVAGTIQIPVNDVEVLNVESNVFGEDVVTFEFDNKQFTSRIYLP